MLQGNALQEGAKASLSEIVKSLFAVFSGTLISE
jgi:hypothetical protein